MKKNLFIFVLLFGLIFPTMAVARGGEIEAESTSAATAAAVIESSPNILQSQPLYPFLLPMIPGVVGDATSDMPTFADLLPLTRADKVVKIISYTRGGRIAGFSRLEDVDSDLLNLIPVAVKKLGQKDATNIRFRVMFKMSSKSIGSGGGAGGAASGAGTSGGQPMAWASNANIMPSFVVNTADPKFIIKFYLIKAESTVVDYNKEGWKKLEPKTEVKPPVSSASSPRDRGALGTLTPVPSTGFVK